MLTECRLSYLPVPLFQPSEVIKVSECRRLYVCIYKIAKSDSNPVYPFVDSNTLNENRKLKVAKGALTEGHSNYM